MMNKNKNTITGFVLFTLSIALLLDIKYKGLFYRLFAPKRVHSSTEQYLEENK